MFVIMLFAAGITATALLTSQRSAAAGAAPAATRARDTAAAHPNPAAQRGFTLQTLIVTAVLVALAVGVGTLFAALINNASDDFEETTAEIAPRCNAVEIYDPEVAANNEVGTQIAYANFVNPAKSNSIEKSRIQLVEFKGSAIGCLPVCVWIEPSHGSPLTARNRELEAGEVLFVRDLSQRRDLIINLERPLTTAAERRIYLLAAGASEADLSYFAKDGTGLGTQLIHDAQFEPTTATYAGTGANARVKGPVARVAVAPNQKECHTYDQSGNVLLAGS